MTLSYFEVLLVDSGARDILNCIKEHFLWMFFPISGDGAQWRQLDGGAAVVAGGKVENDGGIERKMEVTVDESFRDKLGELLQSSGESCYYLESHCA
ncbi:hypothetical protein PIB30_050338 [Stylosanthes scabra]|uniref:Uncharacterized protein n=1 Tax=Stylosanthes scabra TaxID=79078 RepID=A0ABU6UGZ0_9FABA|nr:hypothetical protein [Stylosanthes scabra]